MRCALTILVSFGLLACGPAPVVGPDDDDSQADDDDSQADDDDDSLVDDDDAGPTDDDDSTPPEVVEGPLGLELVRLEPGTFWMGSPEDEPGRHDNEALHEVTLSRAVLFGRVTVTQGQYEELTGRTPSTFSDCGAACPVETLPWDEAAAATNLLSDLAGLQACYDCAGEGPDAVCTSSGDPYACPGYRLPTEAEWEYAARSAGAVDGMYPSGGSLLSADDLQDCDGQLELSDGSILDDHAWYCGNAAETPHPVGLLEPNVAGLYDLAGNVWEYVHDWYAPYPDGPVTDPWGPESGDQRLKRGGPWKKYPVDQRIAERFEYDPALFFNTMGFRVARTAPED